MEKSFQEVLNSCNFIESNSLYITKDAPFKKISEECISWYKTEVSKGNEKQAIEILLQNYEEAKNTKFGITGMAIGVVAVVSFIIGWEIIDAKNFNEKIKAGAERKKERENKQKIPVFAQI